MTGWSSDGLLRSRLIIRRTSSGFTTCRSSTSPVACSPHRTWQARPPSPSREYKAILDADEGVRTGWINLLGRWANDVYDNEVCGVLQLFPLEPRFAPITLRLSDRVSKEASSMGRQVATPSLLWAGRVNWKLAPRGTVAAAHTRPPWASMIERQIDSPMPIPPGLVV